MSVAENVLRVVSSMVVVTGLLGMLTVILSSLEARRREMAVLRSVGARPVHVFALFMSEAGMLALLGAAAGVVLLYVALLIGQPIVAREFGLHMADRDARGHGLVDSRGSGARGLRGRQRSGDSCLPAVALRRAFDEDLTMLARRRQGFGALEAAASLRISASLDLYTVLHEVVESARALIGARYGAIAADLDQGLDGHRAGRIARARPGRDARVLPHHRRAGRPHMRGLISDLLDAGRIDTGTLSVAPEPSEVAGLVDQARNTFLSGGGRHTVVIDVPPDMPPI